MWMEINRFKGALRLLELSSNEAALSKAEDAFIAADLSHKGRLGLQEFLVRATFCFVLLIVACLFLPLSRVSMCSRYTSMDGPCASTCKRS